MESQPSATRINNKIMEDYCSCHQDAAVHQKLGNLGLACHDWNSSCRNSSSSSCIHLCFMTSPLGASPPPIRKRIHPQAPVTFIVTASRLDGVATPMLVAIRR